MKTEQEIRDRITALEQGPDAGKLHLNGFVDGLKWVLGLFDSEEDDEESDKV